MPKKPPLTLEDVWQLEDEHTAFVGSSTGATGGDRLEVPAAAREVTTEKSDPPSALPGSSGAQSKLGQWLAGVAARRKERAARASVELDP